MILCQKTVKLANAPPFEKRYAVRCISCDFYILDV